MQIFLEMDALKPIQKDYYSRDSVRMHTQTRTKGIDHHLDLTIKQRKSFKKEYFCHKMKDRVSNII
jgi:hypothetical protein